MPGAANDDACCRYGGYTGGMKVPQFSTRDLLWLTLVVAALMGWWADHRQMENRCDDLRVQVKQLGVFSTPQMDSRQIRRKAK